MCMPRYFVTSADGNNNNNNNSILCYLCVVTTATILYIWHCCLPFSSVLRTYNYQNYLLNRTEYALDTRKRFWGQGAYFVQTKLKSQFDFVRILSEEQSRTIIAE